MRHAAQLEGSAQGTANVSERVSSRTFSFSAAVPCPSSQVVRAGRSIANPNLGFQNQLQDFETNKLIEVRVWALRKLPLRETAYVLAGEPRAARNAGCGRSFISLPLIKLINRFVSGRGVCVCDGVFIISCHSSHSYSRVRQERRRLKERFPSLALELTDKEQCYLALDYYEELLESKGVCEGHCKFGKDCPTGEWGRDAKECSLQLLLIMLTINSS